MDTTFVDKIGNFTKVTLVIIALIWILKTLLLLLRSCVYGFKVFIWSRIWKRDLVKLYGEYVVITGATDGIGLALAKQFAERGHSLVIIGRNPQKLGNVKENLETFLLLERKIITVIADLSSLDQLTYHTIGN
ncbi:hydroxysteroid dehydrogenase-like protein 3, partial [Leptotrombidium deliense]